ncbi:MAG: hypothetical protein M1817_005455 [Caeruleum heppii]|nr:MAG: hypothetical protein M1817_005455 [Caeruleum heppii]
MSSLIRLSTRTRALRQSAATTSAAASRSRPSLVLGRGLRVTGSRMALSESDRNRDGDNLEQKYEDHKNDQLQKQKEGKGHWKAELASDSESAVKADRGEASISSEEDIKNLQKQTADHAQKNKGQ